MDADTLFKAESALAFGRNPDLLPAPRDFVPWKLSEKDFLHVPGEKCRDREVSFHDGQEVPGACWCRQEKCEYWTEGPGPAPSLPTAPSWPGLPAAPAPAQSSEHALHSVRTH